MIVANYKSEFEFTRDTHISPYRVSYGVSFVGILKKTYQDGSPAIYVNIIIHDFQLTVYLIDIYWQ